MDSLVLNGFIFIILILLSAFFSSAETAFTALSRIKLRSLVDQGVKGSKKLQFILRYPRRLLTVILIGNNITNVAASAIATTLMTKILQELGINNMAAALSIITGIMTFIILTFGEITPKTIAMKNPSKWALTITPTMSILIIIFYPIISIFMLITNGISRLFGVPTQDERKILSEDEIRTILKLAEEDGILEAEEKNMMDGVFSVAEKIVREIMTPRTDAICIESSVSVADAIRTISENGHSRVPVYEDKIDNIIGIIHAKDLLNTSDPENTNIKKFVRDAEFIPETKNIEDLLQHMKRAKFHMAIVMDEYGGMAGLVTFEDIIEEIVGEIQDEFDTDKSQITELSNSSYRIDASLSIDDLPNDIKEILPEDQDDYDTVGGLVLYVLGSFPKKGETCIYQQLEMKVTEIRKRRIITVEMTRIPV